VQPPVPDGQGEVGVADGQGAGQVHGISSAERVGAGQVSGVALDGSGQLDRSDGSPVLFPGLLGCVEIGFGEVMVAAGRGQGGAHFGVGQAAGQGGAVRMLGDAGLPWRGR
jgi:hypothetical protein